MLRATLLVLGVMVPVLARADREPVEITSYVGFSFGGASHVAGSLGERIVPQAPVPGSTPLAMRFVLGGSAGRGGVELFLAGSGGLADAAATDARHHDRGLSVWGLSARYALVNHRYFLVAARAGFQHGRFAGEPDVTTPFCDRTPREDGSTVECPPDMTYTPPGYSVIGITTGLRLQLQGRPENGLIAGFVDLDLSPVRVTFPEETRWGTVRTIVFGLAFGAARR